MQDIVERETTTLVMKFISISDYHGALKYIQEVLGKERKAKQVYLLLLACFRSKNNGIAYSILTGDYGLDFSKLNQNLKTDIHVPPNYIWESKKAFDKLSGNSLSIQIRELLFNTYTYVCSQELGLSLSQMNMIFEPTPLDRGSIILKINCLRYLGRAEAINELIIQYANDIIKTISSYPKELQNNPEDLFYTKHDDLSFLLSEDALIMKKVFIEKALKQNLTYFAFHCVVSIKSKSLMDETILEMIQYQVDNKYYQDLLFSCCLLNQKSKRISAYALIFTKKLSVVDYKIIIATVDQLDPTVVEPIRQELSQYESSHSGNYKIQEFRSVENKDSLETDLYNDEINLGLFGDNDLPEI